MIYLIPDKRPTDGNWMFVMLQTQTATKDETQTKFSCRVISVFFETTHTCLAYFLKTNK